jgi:hypothetical protein
MALSNALKNAWVRLGDAYDRFAKQGIAPGKPGTRVFGWIISIKRLMHECGASRRGMKHAQTGFNLEVVSASCFRISERVKNCESRYTSDGELTAVHLSSE